MEFIKEHKKGIITIIVVVTIMIVLILLINNFCDKREIQMNCLKPLAEEYCNNLNQTLIGTMWETPRGSCAVGLPYFFSCGHKGERTVGYVDKGDYWFLEEELEGCK